MKKLLFSLSLVCASASFAEAQTQCAVPSAFPGTPVVSATTEGTHVLKASSGCLLSIYATVTAAGWLMVFNSTTVPADGAVTPVECVFGAANTTIGINYAPQPPEWFLTGISVAFSSTGCFTKTTSATAFFHSLVQ